MNPIVQPDLHPDADVLNAFMEHALPDPERGQIVAHMAGCVRCREIVFLARAAAEPEIRPAPAVAAEPRPAWFAVGFRRWRIALIPASVMAAVAAIVLWVLLRPAMQPTQMAKLVPPTTTAAADTAQMHMAARRAEAPNKIQNPARQPLPSSASASEMAQRISPVKSQESNVGVLQMDQLAPNDFARSVPPGRPENSGGAAGGTLLDARSATMARYAPPPQPLGGPRIGLSALPPEADSRRLLNLQATPPAPVTAASPAPAAVSSPRPPDIVAVSGAVSPSSGGFSQAAVQPRPSPGLASQSLRGASFMRLTKRVRLPSGLNAVSSAALLNRFVAVDSAGAVFLSQDGGKHWDAVKVQWSGKAIQVQAPPQGYFAFMPATNATPVDPTVDPAPRTSNESRAPLAPAGTTKTSAMPKAGPPPVVVQFKLATDRHLVWLSTDGKVWRQQ